MAPSVNGRTKRGHCLICNRPYRNERMVDCTNCMKWFCYECVDVTEAVNSDEHWRCPPCESSLPKATKNKKSGIASQPQLDNASAVIMKSTELPSQSVKSKRSNSTASSKRKMKLQLLQEERELLRKERILFEETRKLLEEETDDSQDLDDKEIETSNILANKLLSIQIENGMERIGIKNTKLPYEPIEKEKISQPESAFQMKEEFKKSTSTVHSSRHDPFIHTSLAPHQCAARRSIPNELPIFNGNSYDWPLFISSFERSTELCGFDNYENLMRLQKSLKGIAKSAVSSFLTLPECVPQIISTLKILFGRPEQVLETYINSIRRQSPPKAEKLETLVEFALAVKNLCITLETSKMTEYLNNPMLMHELLGKLPPQMKINWALHRNSLRKYNGLADFADWMYDIATNVCTAIPTLAVTDLTKHNHYKERANIHNPKPTLTDDAQLRSSCKVCSEDCRYISDCKFFQECPLTEKLKLVRNLRLCKLCLKRHRFPCKYPVKCDRNQCQQKHHPLLHKDFETEQNSPSHLNVSLNSETNVYHQNSSLNVRFRILPVTLSNGKKEVVTYAFLDEGSSITMVDEDIARELDIQGETEPLCLKWTGEQQRLERNSRKVLLSIAGNFPRAKQFDNRPARTVKSLSLPKQSVDMSKLISFYPYLTNLPISSYQDAKPRILIGLDNWDLALPLRVKEGNECQPIAAKCRLGWTVFALIPSRNQLTEQSFSYHICECEDIIVNSQELHEAVKKFFAIESLGIKIFNDISSKEIKRAEHIMKSTIIQEENRYTIGLIWKYDAPYLPDSRGMAIQRLKCIEKRIKRNPELGIKISSQLADYIEKGYVKKLTHEELSRHYERVWYLPFFPVINPNKPGKFRIVWDAAAAVNGISLNSLLLKGDDQLSNLIGVLLRFRERKIGFSADIKEMFLRIGIRKEDQQAQRFLWRYGDPNKPLDTYIMTSMTFGATCSPSCAQFVKNTNARKFATEYPRAVESIIQNHYVDDLLDSMDDEKSAIDVARQISLIHSRANFEIRHWRSNSLKLMRTMNGCSQNPEEINMNMDSEENTEKVLGMWWNLKTDCFIYSLKYNKGNEEVLQGKRKPTKRELLQIMMSIYDPLGLISNVLVYLKILLQDIWRSKITWDEPITDLQFSKWLSWLKYLPELKKLSIPRCYIDNLLNWKTSNVQLHIFVDASENASAVAAYLRISNGKNEGTTKCVLVGAKTHVAPIKLQTIPRLELDGALMGARFAKTIRSHLSIRIHNTLYWSDSKIVLNWIRSEDPRKFCKYVAYRVAEIQDISLISNWNYVPTKLNVADEATKWSKRLSFNATDRWFVGPEFLCLERHLWPIEEPYEGQFVNEIVNIHEAPEPLLKLDKFSSYNKLLRIVAYVYKFISLSRKTYQSNITGILNSDELKMAENTLIRIAQKEFYLEEIRTLKNSSSSELQPTVSNKSNIYKLSPYLDEHDILRIRGRLDFAEWIYESTKRPIILARESHLAILIIKKYHIAFKHRNHESVVNEIKQKYYIPKLRRTLNKVRNNC